MRKQTIRTVRLCQIIATAILLIILTAFITFQFKPHQCSWEDCPHENKIFFKLRWVDAGYTQTPIGEIVEYNHFYHPAWTYEQCEDKAYEAQDSLSK